MYNIRDIITMDNPEPKVKRNKKSDKQKKTFEKNGTFTQKHIRLAEAMKTQQSKKSPKGN
jgi:hypothetical protein